VETSDVLDMAVGCDQLRPFNPRTASGPETVEGLSDESHNGLRGAGEVVGRLEFSDGGGYSAIVRIVDDVGLPTRREPKRRVSNCPSQPAGNRERHPEGIVVLRLWTEVTGKATIASRLLDHVGKVLPDSALTVRVIACENPVHHQALLCLVSKHCTSSYAPLTVLRGS
jgi:hypothetical protein